MDAHKYSIQRLSIECECVTKIEYNQVLIIRFVDELMAKSRWNGTHATATVVAAALAFNE